MGAYLICHKCNAGNDQPTLRELIEGPVCHGCNYPLPVSRSKDALLEIADRIERIEAHLGLPPP